MPYPRQVASSRRLPYTGVFTTGAAMTSELTLYEVLGVPPGVTTEAVKHAYEEKSRLLTPERLAGAPEIVDPGRAIASNRGRHQQTREHERRRIATAPRACPSKSVCGIGCISSLQSGTGDPTSTSQSARKRS